MNYRIVPVDPGIDGAVAEIKKDAIIGDSLVIGIGKIGIIIKISEIVSYVQNAEAEKNEKKDAENENLSGSDGI